MNVYSSREIVDKDDLQFVLLNFFGKQQENKGVRCGYLKALSLSLKIPNGFYPEKKKCQQIFTMQKPESTISQHGHERCTIKLS